MAKERVANEGQACTTAVFWSRIVGTRATGNLPFFTFCYFAVVEVRGHQNIGRLAIVEFVAKQIEEEKNRM